MAWGRRRSALPRPRSEDGYPAPRLTVSPLRARQPKLSSVLAFRRQLGLQAGSGGPPALRKRSLEAGRRAPSGDGPGRPRRPALPRLLPSRAGAPLCLRPTVRPAGRAANWAWAAAPGALRPEEFRGFQAAAGPRLGRGEKTAAPCSPSSRPDPPSGLTSCRRPR